MPRFEQLAAGVLCGTLALISMATGQRLVVDLNQTPPTVNPGSSPAGIWSLGTTAVIAANDGRHGIEPWRSDGTAAGTTLIADLVPGSRGSIVTFLSSTPAVGNGGLFFAVGGADNLSSLWRSDGTAAGTVKLRDFGPLPFGNPRYLTPVGNRVFFAADDGVSGLELWTTDGTPGGTMLVADLAPGAAGSGVRNLAALGGDVCFIATPTTNGQLWRSDGTAAGTVMLHEFGPLPVPFVEVGRFVPFAGALYFVGWEATTGSELWRTDGTTAGTFLVKDVYPGTGLGLIFASTELAATSQALFFNANDGVTGNELWISDGTTAGTRQVVDLHPGSASPRSLMAFGNELLFVAIDTAHGQEPWITDGTAAGTRLIFDVRPGTGSSGPQVFVVDGTQAIFAADDGAHGREPWRTDGTTAGTWLLQDVYPGTTTSEPTPMAAHAGMVLFAADDGARGKELWRTDGTVAGTVLAADIALPRANGAAIAHMTPFADRLAFTADDGVHGVEPWVSDGTATGTATIADLVPGVGSSTPTFLAPLDGALLLGAYVAGQGWSLLRSDGTAAGTSTVKVVNATAGPTPGLVFALLGRLPGRLFLAVDDGVHGAEPWVTDGTAAGTALLADLQPGPFPSFPSGGVASGGELFFFTSSPLPVSYGVWKTDGTTAGTVQLAARSGTPAATFARAVASGRVVFSFLDPVAGTELWRTDGTPQNTGLLLDIAPGSPSSVPRDFVALDGAVLFSAGDAAHGRELWRSDGTLAGTYLLADIANGAVTSSPRGLTRAGGLVYFRANDQISGSELWRTDGTTAGTVMVRDRAPGTAGSTPTSIAAAGSGPHVVFQADDGGAGTEVWTSDGTAAGTVRMSDLEPGALDATPLGFVRAGGQVFFLASPWAVGQELHVLPVAATGASVVEVFGLGCPGRSGGIPAAGADGLPTVGNVTFAFTLGGARPATLAALHLSLTAGTLAFPPCTVHLLPPYATVPIATDGTGQAMVAAPLPALPELAGLALFAQWSVLDAVQARPVTLSDALRLLVGR